MALRKGDRVGIGLINRDYRVKWIGDRMVVLESEDKSCELLTTVSQLESYASLQNPRVRKKVACD